MNDSPASYVQQFDNGGGRKIEYYYDDRGDRQWESTTSTNGIPLNNMENHDFPIYVETSGRYTGYNTRHMIGSVQCFTLFCHLGFALWLLIVSDFAPTSNFWVPTIVIISVLGILLVLNWGCLAVFYSQNIQNGTECQSHSFVIEIFLGSIGSAVGFFAFFWYSFSWIYVFKGSSIYAYPDPTSITEWTAYRTMLTGSILTFIGTAYLIFRSVATHYYPSRNLSKAIGSLAGSIRTSGDYNKGDEYGYQRMYNTNEE